MLGASSYIPADAGTTWTQGLADWITSHVRAFEFFGGCPELVVPDNLRAAVSRAHRYEPDTNPTYHDLARHYGVAVLPARVRRPRDKAKVEVGVQVVERWILAALRHRTIFSLAELNAAIAELVQRLNARALRKLPGSRRSLFEQLDRPALRPLPTERYVFAEWKKRHDAMMSRTKRHTAGNIPWLRRAPACRLSVLHNVSKQGVSSYPWDSSCSIFGATASTRRKLVPADLVRRERHCPGSTICGAIEAVHRIWPARAERITIHSRVPPKVPRRRRHGRRHHHRAIVYRFHPITVRTPSNHAAE